MNKKDKKNHKDLGHMKKDSGNGEDMEQMTEFKKPEKKTAGNLPGEEIKKELEVEELEEEIELLRKELENYKKNEEEYLDRIRRLQADYDNLIELLRKENVKVIDPKGEEFNPEVCEVAVTESVEGFQEGAILEVIRKGYMIDNFLIRPA